MFTWGCFRVDPVNDLQQLGYSSGEFKVQYNFEQTNRRDFRQRSLDYESYHKVHLLADSAFKWH